MPNRSTPTTTSTRAARGRRVRLRNIFLATAVPATVGCAAVDTRGAWAERPPTPAPDATLSYGEHRQKSVHNAYERGPSIAEQLGRHRFRSVELDIHTGKAGRATPTDDWYVYHVDFPGLDGSSCRTLRDCLREIASFQRAEPDHDVLTVFVDLKDPFGPGHGPRDLDRVLRAELGSALLEPIDLVARCPEAATLEDAVAGRCRWPSLGELRGRVVVALTGGSLCRDTAPLRGYMGVDATRRAAFVAPNVDDGCALDVQRDRGDVVFFNLAHGSFHHARAIAEAGLVSRAYQGGMEGGLDDPGVWFEAADAGVNILATDRVDAARHPWTDVLVAPAPAIGRDQARTAAPLAADVARGRSMRATR